MEKPVLTADESLNEGNSGVAVRIGLVGCGRVVEFGYLPAFRHVRGLALVAMADVHPARCRTLAPDIPAFPSIQSLVQTGGVDALIITAPTRFHLEYARCAAEAGLPSLVEKPPGVNVQEASQLQTLKPAPWIAFNRRFEPSLAAMRQVVRDHQEVRLRLELQYRRTTWKPFDMHDDALLDLGPHLVDLVRWVTGSEICSARGSVCKEQHAEFELMLTRGRAVVICSTNRPYRERMELTDANGRLLASHRRGGLVAGILARLRPTSENPLVHSLAGQLEAFAQAVRGGTAGSLASASDGLAVMMAIEAVRRSAAEGGISVSPQ